MWENKFGKTAKHLQKFMLPSGDGVEMASMLVRSTSSNGSTTSKNKDGGMKAALFFLYSLKFLKIC